MPGIALALVEQAPDIVALSEYRRATGGQIAGILADRGLSHQADSGPEPGENGLLIASRYPLLGEPSSITTAGVATGRALIVRTACAAVVCVHGPSSGTGAARSVFWRALVTAVKPLADSASLIVGDFNTGRDRLDREDGRFKSAGFLGELAGLGYVDVWRAGNPDGREASWESHSRRGFRIDHVLASRDLAGKCGDSGYIHRWREAKLSDHSPVYADFSGVF